MTDEREELKGKLLLLWLEDLKNDKEPGHHPETRSLTTSEIEEVMSLARFIKGNFFPSECFPVNMGEYAKRLSKRVLEERTQQVELNRAAIREAAAFSDLVLRTINSLGIDKTVLQVSLALPRTMFSDLEAGKVPPHRLPLDTMVRLLVTLRLASIEIIGLIRKSSLDWATAVYGSGQTQLGRIDVSTNNAERRKLMEDQGGLSKELERIESYCSVLSTRIPEITKGAPSSIDSSLEDDETWLHH